MSLNLEDLPDLVLHKICTLLSSPFDLINLGNTCKKLKVLTNASSLWIKLAADWCEGIWQWIDDLPETEDARTWFIALLHSATKPPPDTKTQCLLGDGEEWARVESKQFRCYLGMLRWAYGDRDVYRHPCILFRRWIYDVALFQRNNPYYKYENEDALPISTKRELAALGGGAQRDLRARKFPNINPLYYVRYCAKSQLRNLFPYGPNGILCPLLICYSEMEFENEISGPEGLVICVSMAVTKLLVPRCLSGNISLSHMARAIKSICRTFYTTLMTKIPNTQYRQGCVHLKPIIVQLAENDDPFFDDWQKDLDTLDLNLKWRDIIKMCSHLLVRYDLLDALVDKVKNRWRSCLHEEIFSVLKVSPSDPHEVVRMNLTDSDIIGGDNRRQEMSSAAFISDSGVLVVWQLTGRGRY